MEGGREGGREKGRKGDSAVKDTLPRSLSPSLPPSLPLFLYSVVMYTTDVHPVSQYAVHPPQSTAWSVATGMDGDILIV